MTIVVRKPGLQTTIQGKPRIGQRHFGVPSSGPADPLSMALANRLVGNTSTSAALETTLTGVALSFRIQASIAITGATARCTVNDEVVQQHATIRVQPGDEVLVGSAERGVRSYVAVAGGLLADDVLGSCSTYLSAGFGGHRGRALTEGDELLLANPDSVVQRLETPAEFRVPILNAWTLRAGWSTETSWLQAQEKLFTDKFTIATRSDRMGIRLDGATRVADSDGQMPSVPVFPGVIQCTEEGSLFILSVDSGTTGGYPRVAKITRADLHLLGQLRPGDRMALLERSGQEAARELQEKHHYWRTWLPDIADVI